MNDWPDGKRADRKAIRQPKIEPTKDSKAKTTLSAKRALAKIRNRK